MKPIGPYVAARELPSATNAGAVRTLRATDRLTGMPVLLHVLPYALTLPELPDHPHLLPFVDSGMDGDHAYVVTELPLQAVPATDTTLAARGALRALSALHGHGLSHGGISPAQLWSVDGQVVLTGAGLPWHDSPTPHSDLQALVGALEDIGIFPPALRPLRDTPEVLDARAALALLESPAEQSRPVEPKSQPSTPENPVQVPAEVTLSAGAAPVGTPPTPPATHIPSPTRPSPTPPSPSAATSSAAPSSSHSAAPVQTGLPLAERAQPRATAPGLPAQPATTAPASSRSRDTSGGGAAAPEHASTAAPVVQAVNPPPDPVPAPPVNVPSAHDGTPIVLGADGETESTADAVTAEVKTDGSSTSASALPGSAASRTPARPSTTPSAARSRKGKSVIQRPEHPAQGARAQDQGSLPATALAKPTNEPAPLPAVRLGKAVATPASQTAPSELPAPASTDGLPPPSADLQPSTSGETPQETPTGGTPVPAFSTAPAGTVETPQERRRRQNEERRAQAMLDAQAAAKRKAEQLRAEAAARHAETGAASTTIQIGFAAGGASGGAVSSPVGGSAGSTVIGEDDLPDWTPAQAQTPDGAGEPHAHPRLRMRDVERLPESLRRAPEPEPAPEERSVGRLPARHAPGDPIRIGWDEDDSWRVVKTVPDSPAPASRTLRIPRIIPALLVILTLLGGVIWAVRSVRPTTPVAAPAVSGACCDVAFTLRGAAGTTARLSVDSAPPDANLTPGQDIGVAPGKLSFPVQGTYRLRVVADGYSPGVLTVTVPRTQPVSIDLGP